MINRSTNALPRLVVPVLLTLLMLPVTADAQATSNDQSEPIVIAQADTDTAADTDDEVDGDEGDADAQAGQDVSTLQRGGRMEFDTRLVRGERAGSGAVFLFQRPPRALPSMIERRSSYLDGTVHQVFGDEGVQRLNESRSED